MYTRAWTERRGPSVSSAEIQYKSAHYHRTGAQGGRAESVTIDSVISDWAVMMLDLVSERHMVDAGGAFESQFEKAKEKKAVVEGIATSTGSRGEPEAENRKQEEKCARFDSLARTRSLRKTL